MKAMKEFGYNKHRRLRRSFWQNTYRLKVVNHFGKKVSILDAWHGPKYTSGRRMKTASYANL